MKKGCIFGLFCLILSSSSLLFAQVQGKVGAYLFSTAGGFEYCQASNPLVSQSGGFLYLNYTGLIPVLWKYTQEQQKKIVSQQAQIDELKVQLEAIKASIQELKK
ncbi:MAG: hypothetical protein RSC04_02170 [Bacteroidales bacterium]